MQPLKVNRATREFRKFIATYNAMSDRQRQRVQDLLPTERMPELGEWMAAVDAIKAEECK
jgi:hypothetical protein